MNMPAFAVVIPAYNQADFLADAIQSVLSQSHTDFELIVVNDGSTDATGEIVARFDDPRLRTITQPNRGLPAARNRGYRESTAPLLAFLDADDLFHPDKLAAHVAFFAARPEIGASYNARYEIAQDGAILSLWRPPLTATTADFALGFPFAPSDMTVRRDWLDRVGGYDESYTLFSEDLDITLRLGMAGCRFAGIDRALNYRRYHAGRVLRALRGRCDAAVRALTTALATPACPPEVRALRAAALGTTYTVWAYQAFVQGEAALAHELLRAALAHDPAILGDGGRGLLHLFAVTSIRDGGDHEAALRRLFAALPPELRWLVAGCDATIARASLLRGVRDLFWGRPEAARHAFAQAARHGSHLDEPLQRQIVDELLGFEHEHGTPAATAALAQISAQLAEIGESAAAHWIQGCYFVNRAFRAHRAGAYAAVPDALLHAIRHDTHYLANRGILSILARSMLGMARQIGRPAPSPGL